LLFAEIPQQAMTNHGQPAQPAFVQPAPAQPAQPAFVQPAPTHQAPVLAQPQPQPVANLAIPGVPASTGQPAMGYGAPVVQPVWHETVPTPAPHVVPAALVAAAMSQEPALSPLSPHVQPAASPSAAAQPAAATQPAPAEHAPAQPSAAFQAAPAVVNVVDPSGRRVLEANIGTRTETNFWVGFDDDIALGGVFMPTYDDFEQGAHVALRVTLPAGASFVAAAKVDFLRDAVEIGDPQPPGVGFRFEGLGAEHKELARQFMQRRRPLFYDVS
jgi:hypothetical protein